MVDLLATTARLLTGTSLDFLPPSAKHRSILTSIAREAGMSFVSPFGASAQKNGTSKDAPFQFI